MTEDELKVIKKYYSKLSEFAKKEESLQHSHSIDEAEYNTELKRELEQEADARIKIKKTIWRKKVKN